jgi:hypothetical protein
MKYLLGSFIISAILFLGITIPTSVFIGTGYILSYLFNLSLFNATLLCMGSAFVFAFTVFIFFYDPMEKRASQSSEEDLYDCPVCTYQRKMARAITLTTMQKKKEAKKLIAGSLNTFFG